VFKPGNHGSTFGGNPLACAAALTTLETIEQEKLLTNAVKIGDFIRSGMAAALADVKGVVAVRGMGLMLGIELDRPCGELTQRALDAGLLADHEPGRSAAAGRSALGSASGLPRPAGAGELKPGDWP
jgi:acetylornithine aminotransferase